MDNENSIKIDKNTLLQLLQQAHVEIPSEINSTSIQKALDKDNIDEQNHSYELEFDENSPKNNILVVDDIGVVTYQLKVLLQKIGYNVQVARDIYNGINKFLKYKYDYVIMDLFVSTEQEGYILLNEVKKIITTNNLDTKIIVITASNKSESKLKCLNCGADDFLRKETGWQEKLMEIVGPVENDMNIY